VASGLANTGNYDWLVPAVNSLNCRISVEARDAWGNTGSFHSGDFTIISVRPEDPNFVLQRTPIGAALDTNIIIDFNVPMNRWSVESAFSFTDQNMGATAVLPGTFAWSEDRRQMTFTPDALLTAGSTYTVKLETGAVDEYGNGFGDVISYSFAAAPVDNDPPRIGVDVEGQPLRDNDAIEKNMDFVINVTDNISLDADSIQVAFDGAALFHIQAFIGFPTNIEAKCSASDLAPGTHYLEVIAKDAVGLTKVVTIEGLSVAAADAAPKLLSEVLVYPTVFSPSRGEVATFAYSLNKDESIEVFIFGPTGGVEWRRRFAAGSNGGKAGYNTVEFNGISDVTRVPLSNGIYVAKIVAQGAGNKAIGTGRVVVFK
jgi:hypothetical protein